jgi:hypothetical protein
MNKMPHLADSLMWQWWGPGANAVPVAVERKNCFFNVSYQKSLKTDWLTKCLM